MNGNDVTVTVHVRRRTAVLSAVGITHISARATATAAVLQGTTNEDAGPSLGRARALVGIADSVPFARRR